MTSNLPEWEQLLNAALLGVAAGGTYAFVADLLKWRRQRKVNRG